MEKTAVGAPLNEIGAENSAELATNEFCAGTETPEGENPVNDDMFC